MPEIKEIQNDLQRRTEDGMAHATSAVNCAREVLTAITEVEIGLAGGVDLVKDPDPGKLKELLEDPEKLAAWYADQVNVQPLMPSNTPVKINADSLRRIRNAEMVVKRACNLLETGTRLLSSAAITLATSGAG